MSAATDLYAVIWHDTHIDPEVHLFDSEPQAQAWFQTELVEYLRDDDPTQWAARHVYADRVEAMTPAAAWESFTNQEYFIEYLDAWILPTQSPASGDALAHTSPVLS